MAVLVHGQLKRKKTKISPSLLNLSYLSYLDLGWNSFSGTIPMFIGSMTRLSYLDLTFNSFNGTIPSSIGSLTKLRYFDISNNYLNRIIPTVVGSLTELRYLILGGNFFSGSIPTSIGSLSKLTHFDLSNNNLLNGSCIPKELGNLETLQDLTLEYLTSCTIENIDWLSHMSDLNRLVMDSTSLAKANKWVNVILSLQKLSYLSLHRCDLSEVMHPYSSSSVNSSSSSIVTLDLSYNNLNSSMYHWLLPLASNKLRTPYLSKNMLDGKSFGNLCSLTTLDFSYNVVVVKFPDFLNTWSGCTSVTLKYLYASHNQLTGTISDEIQMFSPLEQLYLDHNELNESISEKVWELPKLQILDISSNYLKGEFFEAKMSNLSYVDSIDLRSCNLGPRFQKWIQNTTQFNIVNNSISNKVPLKLCNTWHDQLTYLNLSSNNINGRVPDLLSSFDPNYSSIIDLSSNNFYGHIPNVPYTSEYLDFSRNKFHGGISFLCQISSGFLRYLDLSHNSLTGKIPDCLGHFKELGVLNLGYNILFGRLPNSVASLIRLEVLSLYNNNFSGELPMLLNNCTMLTFLDLGANKFTCNVPFWIGERLTRLYALSLSSNKLFGDIPLQLCQLANVQILDLSMNNLNGTIPSCIKNLTTLVQGVLSQKNFHIPRMGYYNYIDRAMIHWQGNIREFSINLGLFKGIDLSGNNLIGQIPCELTNLHGLIALNLSNNALTGKIPWEIGEMKNLLSLDISRNNLSGEIPSSSLR
ncbi:uncharacterized protein LOC143543578 [Bidens hawaiensis]|uniref:uncharacterized protein LOC143543578 n=1 Tax=Bidens hawaiensis TaxID=980011 RepID=UPI004049E0A9